MVEWLQWLGLKTYYPLLLCSTDSCVEAAVCVPTAVGTTARVRPHRQHVFISCGENIAHVGQMNGLDHLDPNVCYGML